MCGRQWVVKSIVKKQTHRIKLPSDNCGSEKKKKKENNSGLHYK